MREADGYKHSQAYQLGLFLDLIRHFLGRDWIPDKIGIEHTIAPTIAQEYFPGSRFLTQQPMGYISVPRACLHRPVHRPAPDPGVAGDPVLSANLDFLDTMRAILKAYLSEGYPSARFMAELMDVSERTLFRRLAARNLTYGALIDQVRFEEAKKLLQAPGALIEDVAISVGFIDQSNFTRMFRRIGGQCPKEFRKEALG
jgi:AraC-like DNA-binding protein